MQYIVSKGMGSKGVRIEGFSDEGMQVIAVRDHQEGKGGVIKVGGRRTAEEEGVGEGSIEG